MTHTKLQNLLSAYLDHELETTQARIVADHVKDCNLCQQLIAEMKALRKGIKDAAVVDLDPMFSHSVMRAIRQELELDESWTGADLFARRLLLGLFMLVLLIMGVGSMNRPEQNFTFVHYLVGEPIDSSARVLTVQGEISKEDVLLAAMSH